MKITVTDDDGTVLEQFTPDAPVPESGLSRALTIAGALRDAATLAELGMNEWGEDE